MARWVRFQWFLRLSIAPALMLLVGVFDPLGLDSASDRASLLTVQRLFAPFYPDRAQDDIVVVLIDDEQLPLAPASVSPWPPRLDDYARLLDVLGGQGNDRPKGIFVDLLIDRWPTDQDPATAFCAAIARLADANVPVAFAAIPGAAPDHTPRALRACSPRPSVAAVSWVAPPGHYKLASDDTDPPLLTAAAWLYRTSLPEDHGTSFTAGAMGQSLAVMWGARAPVPDPKCALAGGMATSRAQQSLTLFGQGISPDPAARDAFLRQQKCPFHGVLAARDIVRALPVEEPIVARMLKDKWILIGADLAGIPDRAASPVHGSVPGVFLHAMALDNLLVWGEGFIRPAGHVLFPIGGLEIRIDEVLQVIGLVLMAVIIVTLTRSDAPRHGRAGSLIWAFNARIIGLLSLVSLLSMIVMVTFVVARWAPINWGGVLISGLLMMLPWHFSRYRKEDTYADPSL